MSQNRTSGGGFSITAIIGALLLIAFISTLTPEPLPDPTASPTGAPAPSAPAEPTATPAEPAPTASTPAGETAPLPTGPAPLAVPEGLSPQMATAMLALLPVTAETGTAYNRELYNHWTDVDADGCSTRAEVLTLESAVATTTTTPSGCTIATGSWFSPYDGATIIAGPDLDIDHVVALGEAHYSGAASWDAAKKAAFANDLGYPGSLIAVSATTNRSKSDRDPAEWMPPAADYKCTYTAVWVAVKWRWGLTVDAAEYDAISRTLSGCAAGSVTPPTK
jgi:hypothetical protein